MCASAPSVPPPVAIPPVERTVQARPEQSPDSGGPQAAQARVSELQRRLRQEQESSTAVTGARGLQGQASTGTKQLYGQ